MKVKIKRLHKDAVIPQYAMPYDAGMDITAVSKKFDHETGCVVYGTGISVEIPEGYVGLIFPRSSIYKHYTEMTNCVGVIDAGYRGEIKVIMRAANRIVRPIKLWNRLRAIFCKNPFKDQKSAENALIVDYFNSCNYKVGDRVAQLIIMPFPTVEFDEVESLSDSERGQNGHGSTGD